MKLSIPLFLTCTLFLLMFAADALACQCGNKPTILEEMKYSGVIVVGQIESVKKIREEEGKYDLGAYRSATLVVDKVYSGSVEVGDKLLLAQSGGSDCGFEWSDESVGTKWLFYLGEPSTEPYRYMEDAGEISENEKAPMYRTSGCGRSTNLTSAAKDFAYLDRMTKLKGKTRVSGELTFGERSVEGIEVRITGKNSRFKTKYVKGGFFEIYDIAPGDYLLELFPPLGWKVVNHWRTRYETDEYSADTPEKLKKNQRFIRVTAGEHIDVDLSLAPDTMIKGRVLSPTGKPMAKVCVLAVPMEDSGREWQSCTDTKGEFQFETLNPGNYLLVANPGGKIDNEQPFPQLYYPGVTSRENAGIISVQPGKYDLGIDIQIPQTTRLIEIAGRILFADDKPAKGTWVSFEPRDKEHFDRISARADDEGRFSLKIPSGAAGVVRGSSYFSEYSHSNCPEIMTMVKLKSSSEISTTELEITGTEPIIHAILKFPFGGCENNK